MSTAEATHDAVFRSAEDFEAAMFPRAIREREAACEAEHPHLAGSRLAEEALARLRRRTTSEANKRPRSS